MEGQMHRFKVKELIGQGGFGIVYSAVDVPTNNEVAIKVQANNTKRCQLENEVKVYQRLHGNVPLPIIQYFLKTPKYSYLVMELLGPSLEDLFNICDRTFSLQTVLLIAEQMLFNIRCLHAQNYIHRDIKPENLLIGNRIDRNKIFIIDFGLAKLYQNNKNQKMTQHIPYREKKPFLGTPRYASVNAHLGKEQSRRDDLESIGYILIYFLRGELPWQRMTSILGGGEEIKKQQKSYYKKLKEIKIATPLQNLCHQLPNEFYTYLKYCRSLKFDETPDYDFLQNIFRSLFKRMNFVCEFEWTSKM